MSRILYKLKKILPIINIPKHIKKFFLKRKIRRYKNEEKNKTNLFLKVINFFLVIVISATFVYFNLAYRSSKVLIISSTVLGVIILAILIRKVKQKQVAKSRREAITSLMLKDENEKVINQWDIHDLPSLLIGKKTKSNEVDVDLSEATYSSLISRKHAVMNNTGENWYFEDIGSSNGSGIRRKNSDKKFKVKEGKPYQINPGDTIYIANTKLVVK